VFKRIVFFVLRSAPPRRHLSWRLKAGLVGLLLGSGCLFASPADDESKTGPSRYLTVSMVHDTMQRTYHIHLPPGFSVDKPAPLVIALHGGGGVGRNFDENATQGSLTVAADSRNIVLVFPEGIGKQWNDGRSEVRAGKPSPDDVGFIAAIIDAMVKTYGIDPHRVYVTGISNGGFMSVRLALDVSEAIAAIAPVAAQFPLALTGKTPKRPISVMLINGTEDPLVPFQGGHVRLFRFGRSRGKVHSTAETIETFRLQNHCRQVPKQIKIQDTTPDDGATVEIEEYPGGLEGSEVILVKILGGGHTWPGGNQYLKPRIIGPVCRDINASEMILDFFLRHSRTDPVTRAQ
jgi:polyhydroxybutyrate depolymerase